MNSECSRSADSCYPGVTLPAGKADFGTTRTDLFCSRVLEFLWAKEEEEEDEEEEKLPLVLIIERTVRRESRSFLELFLTIFKFLGNVLQLVPFYSPLVCVMTGKCSHHSSRTSLKIKVSTDPRS